MKIIDNNLKEKIEAFTRVKLLFDQRKLVREDVEDIVQIGCIIASRKPWRDDYIGKNDYPTTLNAYVEYLATSAVRFHQKALETKGALQQSGYSEDELDQLVSGRAERGFDPLAEDTSPLRVLEDPPYRVIFIDDGDFRQYRYDPAYLPRFAIVPNNEAAVVIQRVGESQRRHGLAESELHPDTAELLRARRQVYRGCLREMITEYIRSAAWEDLPLELKGLVTDFNKRRLEPTAIRRAHYWSSSTIQSKMKTLARHGFSLEWDQRLERERMMYNPITGGSRQHFKAAARRLVARHPVPELVEESFNAIGKVEVNEITDDVASRALKIGTQWKLEKAMDFGAEQEYDRSLRGFMRGLVERPSYCGDCPWSELEAELQKLTERQRKQVIFRAVRTRSSLRDVLSLGDVFALEPLEGSLDISWAKLTYGLPPIPNRGLVRLGYGRPRAQSRRH